MAKRRKVPLDGYIAPRNPANVLQNPSSPPPAFPDPQVMPAPSAPLRPVVEPPAPGPAQPPPPLVP